MATSRSPRGLRLGGLAGLTLAAALLVACGTRTEPWLAEEPAPDAFVADAFVADALAESSPEAGPSVDAAPEAPPGCPARRPRANDGCEVALEGLECPYGDACRTGCVCERGSWICLRDSCFAACPTPVPYGLPCDPTEIDRECDYLKGCPSYCTCDPVDGGARWRCLGPPC